jgi:prefoldin subunit 5
METSFLRERQNLRTKLPDIKRTLEMVALLKQKHEGDEKAIETNFLISDNVWSKAKIPNDTGRVGLWLGANVMVEYSHMDALVLLGKNLANAEAKLAELDSSIDFLKD